jgi:hypothetical protein
MDIGTIGTINKIFTTSKMCDFNEMYNYVVKLMHPNNLNSTNELMEIWKQLKECEYRQEILNEQFNSLFYKLLDIVIIQIDKINNIIYSHDFSENIQNYLNDVIEFVKIFLLIDKILNEFIIRFYQGLGKRYLGFGKLSNNSNLQDMFVFELEMIKQKNSEQKIINKFILERMCEYENFNVIYDLIKKISLISNDLNLIVKNSFNINLFNLITQNLTDSKDLILIAVYSKIDFSYTNYYTDLTTFTNI